MTTRQRKLAFTITGLVLAAFATLLLGPPARVNRTITVKISDSKTEAGTCHVDIDQDTAKDKDPHSPYPTSVHDPINVNAHPEDSVKWKNDRESSSLSIVFNGHSPFKGQGPTAYPGKITDGTRLKRFVSLRCLLRCDLYYTYTITECKKFENTDILPMGVHVTH